MVFGSRICANGGRLSSCADYCAPSLGVDYCVRASKCIKGGCSLMQGDLYLWWLGKAEDEAYEVLAQVHEHQLNPLPIPFTFVPLLIKILCAWFWSNELNRFKAFNSYFFGPMNSIDWQRRRTKQFWERRLWPIVESIWEGEENWLLCTWKNFFFFFLFFFPKLKRKIHVIRILK